MHFRFLKNSNKLNFLKVFEKTTKKVIPRKLQRIEQSYLEARFAIFESTLTGTNYRVGIFRFLKNNFILNFLKIFEKITKNVISRKLQRIEQSYLETRFAILDCTVTVPNYRVGNFRFCEKIYYKFSENFEKNHKKRHISKTTKFWAVIFAGKIRNLWEYSDRNQIQGWEFWEKKSYKIHENFFKKSQKTSYLENYKDLNNHIWRQDL